MPSWRVMLLEGQPTHAPWRRTRTTPAWVISTNSTSPPSDWTAGRIMLMTRATRSASSWDGLVAEVGAAESMVELGCGRVCGGCSV